MKTSLFQIVLLGIFGLAAVGALAALAMFRSSGEGAAQAVDLTMWGTPSAQFVVPYLESVSEASKRTISIRYVEKKADSFEQELVSAIADGISPDLVFIPDSLLLPIARRIAVLPTQTVTERYFLDTYAQAAETFWGPAGAFGIPVMIDPFFMFWNRDHLQGAGIAKPPTQWSALPGLAERLTVRTQAFEISRSTVAMGEYANINNVKELFAALLLQSGNPIVRYVDGRPESAIETTPDEATQALSYYVQFSNPTYPVYSWNRSLPRSRDAFIGDTLTFYFGFASEAKEIRDRNPNLNFDVAPLPQPAVAPTKTTLARTYGIAALKTTPKAAQAVQTLLTTFGTPDAADAISFAANLAPARRDLLAGQTTDALEASLFESAIMGRSWLDPSPAASDGVIERMITSAISGQKDVRGAVLRASQELGALMPRVF